MKQRLALVAGALAIVALIGAVIGFVRRRVERTVDLYGSDGMNGPDGSATPGSREHAAAVNGDRS